MTLCLMLILAQATPEAQKAAAEHFARGVALSERGDYANSLHEFEEAYRVAPRYEVLFNLGLVHDKLNEPVLAWRAFEQYLREGGDRLQAQRRRQVGNELARLRKELADLVIQVDDPGTLVEVDGREEPLPADHVYVLPGRHRVTARRGKAFTSTEIEVHRGERAVVALGRLTDVPEAQPPDVAPVPLVPKPRVQTLSEVAPAAPPFSGEVSPPLAWYKRWYVWAGVAALAAGTAAAIYVETRPAVDVRVNVP